VAAALEQEDVDAHVNNPTLGGAEAERLRSDSRASDPKSLSEGPSNPLKDDVAKGSSAAAASTALVPSVVAAQLLSPSGQAQPPLEALVTEASVKALLTTTVHSYYIGFQVDTSKVKTQATKTDSKAADPKAVLQLTPVLRTFKQNYLRTWAGLKEGMLCKIRKVDWHDLPDEVRHLQRSHRAVMTAYYWCSFFQMASQPPNLSLKPLHGRG
jgi:hypothetical protein